MHQTVMWIKMVLYVVFSFIGIDLTLTGPRPALDLLTGLISKDTGRGYKDCYVETAGRDVRTKGGNVAMRC
jgi:hypothetical protein